MSNNKLIITGNVKDKETGETLPGANVYESTHDGILRGNGTTSDLNGDFTLITSLNENQSGFVTVSMLGYSKATNTVVGGDGDVNWNVNLKKGVGLSTVEVKAQKTYWWLAALSAFVLVSIFIYKKYKTE